MTYPETKCFLLEQCDLVEVGLRRYHTDTPTREGFVPCPGKMGYHDATNVLGNVPFIDFTEKPEGLTHWYHREGSGKGVYSIPDFIWPDHSDPRWPTHCECGYEFKDDDQWQDWSSEIWRRTDTGQKMTLHEAGPGAMWYAYWLPWNGPDGRSLTVKCPNGDDWAIDSRATNCTMKEDKVHRCWIRHGEPPNITVDKNGNTCQAGAGSIQADDYHGFLKNGVFSPG